MHAALGWLTLDVEFLKSAEVTVLCSEIVHLLMMPPCWGAEASNSGTLLLLGAGQSRAEVSIE